AVCGRMTTALSARRPGAGAVPGRWGARLAVRTPPAAFVKVQRISWCVLTSDRTTLRNHLPRPLPCGLVCSGLERLQRDALLHEAHGAVGEGEVGAARMAAAEGAGPILTRGEISAGRHPVVDRRGGVERNVRISPCVRDETPLPPAGDVNSYGPNHGPLAGVFPVPVGGLPPEGRRYCGGR